MASVIAYLLMCLVLASEFFVSSSPIPPNACFAETENMKSLWQKVIGCNKRLVLAGVSTKPECAFFYMDAKMCICQKFEAQLYRLFLQGEKDFFVIYKPNVGPLLAKNYIVGNDGSLTEKWNGIEVAQPKAPVSEICRREKDICYEGKSMLKTVEVSSCGPDFCSSGDDDEIFCNKFSTNRKQFEIRFRNETVPKSFKDVAKEFSQLQVWNKDWNATPDVGCQDAFLTTTTAATPTNEGTTPSTPISLTPDPAENPETTSSLSTTEDSTDSSSLSGSTDGSYLISSTNVAHAGSNNPSTLLYVGLAVGIVLMILGGLIILAVRCKWIPGVYEDPRKVQLKPSRDQIFG